jgi:hypothetical protein
MFVLRKATPVALDAIPNVQLQELLGFWQRKCDGRGIPRLASINPTEVSKLLPRMHLLVVEGPEVFRYSIYGSGVTNPDRLDMTGRTTLDYHDKDFARFVTTHISEVVQSMSPTCYRIEGETDGKPYSYIRLLLPIGLPDKISHVLVGTQRIEVDAALHRDTRDSRSS